MPEYKDIHRINDVLKGRVNRTQMALLEIDPLLSDYVKLKRYLENPLKRMVLVFKTSEYNEMKKLAKKHKVVDDLASFVVSRMRRRVDALASASNNGNNETKD